MLTLMTSHRRRVEKYTLALKLGALIGLVQSAHAVTTEFEIEGYLNAPIIAERTHSTVDTHFVFQQYIDRGDLILSYDDHDTTDTSDDTGTDVEPAPTPPAPSFRPDVTALRITIVPGKATRKHECVVVTETGDGTTTVLDEEGNETELEGDEAIARAPEPRENWTRMLYALYTETEQYEKGTEILEELLLRQRELIRRPGSSD